jgi:hypothetical protein
LEPEKAYVDTMNGRKPPISSIYTRNSSVSSYRPSSGVSSISTQTSNTQPPPPPQVRIPTRTAALAPPAPSAVTRNGVLFVIIDGSPSKQLESNVQVALSKGRTIAELLILGEQKHEQALKQFKVEMYGLAGSLKRELGVRVEFLEGVLNEEQLRTLLGSVLGSGNGGAVSGGDSDRKELHGVLCDLGENKEESAHILDIESAALMDRFLHSVGYVHTIARTTIPLLRVAASHTAAQTPTTSEKTLQCPFFVTTLSPLPPKNVSIHDTALRALLNGLSTPGNRGITFGSADVLLAPEPEPIPQEQQPAIAPTNGWREQEDDFTAGESPTKMWSMWSDMQDQLDNL